ncbi:carboxypeptidase-like regulatory domain-containing protein [Candidatus Saccharibacteria bacterium]|nr:carboxypeptidase-like regulatory domain-containing protein [Candidatus Saccharibacteria bacterium]
MSKWVYVLGGVAAAVLLGLGIYRAIWSATLTLVVAPYDAVIYVDGAAAVNGATKRVRPGEYVVAVRREGFDDEEHKVEVRRGDEARVMVALLPSDGDYSWYMENAEDGLILDSVMSARSTEREEQLTERWPVLNALPQRTNFYELTLFALPSSENPRMVLMLTIYEIPRDGILATPEKFAEYSAAARGWLLEQGLEEGEFEIISGN